MAPTLINIAVGCLLAVALLGTAFDRRSVVLVAGAAAVPDLDSVFALVAIGEPNAVLHSIFLVVGATVLLLSDTVLSDHSRLADRYGWYGVRVAWVAVAAFTVAGIGLDVFTSQGVGLLYPLSNRAVAVDGWFMLSTQEGIVQRYVTMGDGGLQLSSPRIADAPSTDSVIHVDSGGFRIRLIESGWQAIVLLTAVAAIPAKFLVERVDRNGGGES